MDMYNSHLRGIERKLAVFDASMENQMNKLATMYEMTSLKSNQIYKDIETKVYLEGYDTNDMTYMYQEASEESVGKKKGIIKKIFEWFAKLFTAIKEKISGIFHKGDDDDEFEVPANAPKVVDALEKHVKSIKMALVKIKSGNFGGGLADLLKAVLPEITFAAGAVIIMNRKNLAKLLKRTDDMGKEIEDTVDGAESELRNVNDENTIDDAQKSLNSLQMIAQAISTVISNIAKILANSKVGKAVSAAKDKIGDKMLDGSIPREKKRMEKYFKKNNLPLEESVYDYSDDDDYSFYY